MAQVHVLLNVYRMDKVADGVSQVNKFTLSPGMGLVTTIDYPKSAQAILSCRDRVRVRVDKSCYSLTSTGVLRDSERSF